MVGWLAGWLVVSLLGWRSAQCNLWNGKGFQCRVIICQKNDRLHAFISTTAATAPIGSDSMRTFIRENRELSSQPPDLSLSNVPDQNLYSSLLILTVSSVSSTPAPSTPPLTTPTPSRCVNHTIIYPLKGHRSRVEVIRTRQLHSTSRESMKPQQIAIRLNFSLLPFYSGRRS